MKKFLLILPLIAVLGVGCEKKAAPSGGTPAGSGTGTAKVAPSLENPKESGKTPAPPASTPSVPTAPVVPPKPEMPAPKGDMPVPPKPDMPKDGPKPIAPPPAGKPM